MQNSSKAAQEVRGEGESPAHPTRLKPIIRERRTAVLLRRKAYMIITWKNSIDTVYFFFCRNILELVKEDVYNNTETKHRGMEQSGSSPGS